MNYLILFTFLCFSITSQALPIMNLNIASTPLITIYPDHENPNQFYIAPNSMNLAENENKIPFFTYREYKSGMFDKKALMQAIFLPSYRQADLEEAKAQILAKNPQAVFSTLPFIQSEMIFMNPSDRLIEEQLCSHSAGLVGQEQSCSIRFSNKGRKFFGNLLKKGHLVITFHFQYSAHGIIENADGTYSNQILTHAVAAKVDGTYLKQFPDLVQFLN